MKTKILILMMFGLAVASCSKGPHVDTFHRDSVKYACYYSPSIWQAQRTIAICETEKECNDICAKLPQNQ
jgi:hypothetical protein